MILFAVNALQCIVNGEKTAKTAPSPWDFVTCWKDRATTIDNMHAQKNWQRLRMWFRRYPGRQTQKQTDTQTCSSKYFTTAFAGEVINNNATTIQGEPRKISATDL